MTPIIKTILNRFAKGFILLAIIVLVLRLFFYKDVESWISTKVQAYLTELDYGDLQIENMELSVFQNFPNVSVQLNKVQLYEKKDSIRPENTQPILYTEQLNVAFSTWELIRHKNLIVKTLASKNGVFNLLTYEDNTTNLERVFNRTVKQNKSTPTSKKDTVVPATIKSKRREVKLDKSKAKKQLLSVALEGVYFNNFILNYTNPSENYRSQVKLESLSGKLLLNETGLSCDLSSSFEISKSSEFPMVAELGPAALNLNLDFVNATEVINIHDGSLRFKTITTDLKGSYHNSNEKYIDINFDASSNDLAFLSKLIKEDVLLQNNGLVKKTDIILKGHIQGEMEDNIPKIDLNFSISDLSLVIPESKVRFTNIGFDGELHTGEADDFSEAQLEVRNLRGQLPGGSMSGDFFVRNFKNPNLKSGMNLSLDLDNLDNIFNISSIDSLKGKVNFTSNIDGKINTEDQYALDDISRWSLDLEGIEFKYIPTNKHINKLQGNISETKNIVALHDLSMRYDNSDISINGSIKNLYHFIFSKEQNIEAELELKSSQFYTSHFLFNSNGIPAINDRLSNLLLSTKISMSDNNSYDSYFPKINAEITTLSFDLDTLPSVKDITGTVAFEQTQNGFVFDLKDIIGELPYGKASLNGKVLIPDDLQTLDVKANMDISDVPLDYIEDLIHVMMDFDLLDAKHRNREEMTLINGDLHLSGILELFPFAAHDAEITSRSLSFNLEDSSGYNFENLNIQLDKLDFLHDTISKSITGIKATHGKIRVASSDLASIKNIPAYINFEGINDQLKIDFTISKERVSNRGGTLNLDLSDDILGFDLFYRRNDIAAKPLIEDYHSNIGINGDLNATLKLSGAGSSIEDMRSSLKGTIEISSDSLIFDGIDLNTILKKYNRSQKFNLTDISAYVIAGPFGAVVTKGSDFTSLISADLKTEDKTIITKALARWNLNDGVLQTEDVAFRTNLSRISFDGSIDFVKDSIPGFTVFVLDKNGCSLMRQTISGKTDDLQIGKLKLAKTLLGSVINAIKTVVGSNCEIVYDGEIAHPNAAI